MEAWATELLEVWTRNRDVIADTMLDATSNNPYLPVKYTREDLMQIFDGARAMMAEDLGGESSELRDTYMNSVVPGLVAGGQPLSAIAGQIVINAIQLQSVLIPAMSEKHRNQAATFFRNWYCRMCMDTVRIGLEQGAKV
ncbi:hypothetical protein [Polyangium jinanense]|uniref:Uncharacterized protein n=1 Tax=Polyangium jinanense TaxID=2829994 RepID=A0A9X4AS73_9BACT|nr:hypothetical protein [Polyangium jinanense]MDC3954537.1 hypothetical protein [Polyangium jinanense]MDC3980840.1 hypothetical protein [Polyangium jinanense]